MIAGSRRISTRLIKRVLLAVVVVVLVAIVTVFIGYRRILNRSDISISSFDPDSQISLGGIHQTSSKDGVKQWTLDAASARYITDRKEALLDRLSVTFHLEDGRTIHLTADTGVLDTDSRNIVAKGNVVVISDSYRLNCDTLHYDHSNHLMSAPSQVMIIGETFRVRSDRMTFDITTHKAFLQGNVKGTISEKMAL